MFALMSSHPKAAEILIKQGGTKMHLGKDQKVDLKFLIS